MKYALIGAIALIAFLVGTLAVVVMTGGDDDPAPASTDNSFPEGAGEEERDLSDGDGDGDDGEEGGDADDSDPSAEATEAGDGGAQGATGSSGSSGGTGGTGGGQASSNGSQGAAFTPTPTPTPSPPDAPGTSSSPTTQPQQSTSATATSPQQATATPTRTPTKPASTATKTATKAAATATKTATKTPTKAATATYTPTKTNTPPPTPTYTATVALPTAPPDANFNDPLDIPLDSTASVTDFVSFPGGDTTDRVRYSVTGMNNVSSLLGGRARLIISASCFGTGTQNIQFTTGGQTFSCGQKVVDREVTADSDTGTITIMAVAGASTYVQWVLTGTAVRVVN